MLPIMVKLSVGITLVVFQSPYKLRTLFRFKDTLDKKIRFDLVCRYLRSSCNTTYMVKFTDTFSQEVENI